MFRNILLSMFMLFIALFILNEYVRYENAKHVVFQQHQDYDYVLSHKSYCGGSENVRVIEYNGTPLNCATLRLALQQSVSLRAFSLWWQTSLWVTHTQRIVHNIWITSALLLVTVITCIWYGFQSCVQMRLNDQMVKQYERLSDKQLSLPAPILPEPRRRSRHHHHHYDDDDDDNQSILHEAAPPPPCGKTVNLVLPRVQ